MFKTQLVPTSRPNHLALWPDAEVRYDIQSFSREAVARSAGFLVIVSTASDMSSAS